MAPRPSKASKASKASEASPDETSFTSEDQAFQARAFDALFSREESGRYNLTRHHLDAYDHLIQRDGFRMLQNIDRISVSKETEDRKPVTLEVFFGRRVGKLEVAQPTVSPSSARLNDLTYEVALSTDVEVDMRIGDVLVHTFKFDDVSIELCKIPLMLHSRFCMLRDKTDEELREAGECAYDRGGYFVIEGREKVIVGREDVVVNRLYVRNDLPPTSQASHLAHIRAKAPNSAFPRTTTFYLRRNVKTISVVVTRLNTVKSASTNDRDDVDAVPVSLGVPLFVLFRALGIESDRDILNYISEESDVIEFLRPCIIEAGEIAYNQAEAIQFLDRLVPVSKNTLKNILTNDFLPSAGVDFEAKAIFLGRLVRQFVASILGKRDMLVRDDYANKRITVSGTLLGELFRDILVRFRDTVIRRLDAEWASGTWRASGDPKNLFTARNVKTIFETRLFTERIRRSLKGDWSPDESSESTSEKDNAGVLVQEMSRISYFAYVAHVRRVSNLVKIKMSAPHLLRASHWGAVCPVDTPDGPNIGTVCHLASTASLTLEDPDSRDAVAGIILAFPKTEAVSRRAIKEEDGTRVLVNDIWVAVTQDPAGLRQELRAARRDGRIGRDTSISWVIFDRELAIMTDGGRVVRPLLRLEKTDTSYDSSVPLPAQKLIQSPKQWSQLVDSGEVELLDIEEIRSSALVAMKPSEITTKGQTCRYTHCELHPAAALLSVPASTIPFMEYNAAPRNTLALAQLKQAIGVYSTSYQTRMDTVGYVLHHPQLPLVTTRFAHNMWGGNHGHGENLFVAVCTYGGYNIDDAIIINQAAVARGRLRISVYDTFKFEETYEDEDNITIFGRLPEAERMITPGEVLVDRMRISSNTKDQTAAVAAPVKATRKTAGRVDRVYLYPSPSNPSTRSMKLRMRHVRAPDLGDKLATRFSQKGVVGLILPEEDMPFVRQSGIVPDLIFNPHSIPTRNTPSHIIELLLGKAAAVSGVRQFDCTTFSSSICGADPVSEARQALMANGLSTSGDEVMVNGHTGEEIQCEIFTGMNYYGRLKHMVEDKWQTRVSNGPINAITRQPTKTAGGGSGGLRIGEMERDALYAHGVSRFAQESFMQRSDGKVGPMSDMRTIVEGEPDEIIDGGPPNHATVRVPYSFKLLKHELHAMGIGMHVEASGPADAVRDPDDEEYSDIEEEDEDQEDQDQDEHEDDIGADLGDGVDHLGEDDIV